MNSTSQQEKEEEKKQSDLQKQETTIKSKRKTNLLEYQSVQQLGDYKNTNVSLSYECLIKDEQKTDILLIIDATSSMKKFIQGVKESVQQLMINFNQLFLNGYCRMGVVFYRDFPSEMQGSKAQQFEVVKLCDFNIADENKKTEDKDGKPIYMKNPVYVKLQEIEQNCVGGGDTAEDIKGALQIALDKNEQFKIGWVGNQKIVILIADAPAHGSKFSGNCSDNHKNEDMTEEINQIILKGYNMVIIQVSSLLTVMCDEIKRIYEEKKALRLLQIINLESLNKPENQKLIARQILEAINSTVEKCEIMNRGNLGQVQIKNSNQK